MTRLAVCVIIGIVVGFLLICTGLIYALLDCVIAIVFGWIVYLVRELPKVRTNWWGVATAVMSLVLIVIGAHLFLTWLSNESVGAENSASQRGRWRRTVWLVGVVVLMFVAGVAAGGIAHQAGWLLTSPEPLVISDGGGRTAARRAQSVNNLKWTGLALHNYHEKYGTFPSAATFDREGRPLHGWQSMILPYLEQQKLFDRINFTIPWDDPRNLAVFQTELPVYKNPAFYPAQKIAGYAPSHYAGNVRILGGDVRRTLNDVTDGTATTIMAGEVASRFKPWGDPLNWRDPAHGVNRSPDGFGGPFVGGANFLFVDGSVHFIKNTVDPNVLEALSTPRGGERVSSEEY